MNQIVGMFGWAIWVLMPVSVSVAGTEPPQRVARLSGLVQGLGEGEAGYGHIAGAVVQLTPESGDAVVRVSGTDGRFVFEGLPSGRYQLSVERSGYLRLNYGETSFGDPGLPVVLAEGDALDLKLTLRRAGSLSGTIRFLDGLPAADVPVFVNTERLPNATTDERGYYRISGLPPGDYVVSALPPFGAAARARTSSRETNDRLLRSLAEHFRRPGAVAGRQTDSRTIPSNQKLADDQPSRLSRIFYPGTPDAGAAVKVGVLGTSETYGVNFDLSIVGSVMLSGRVLSAEGSPAPGVRVVVAPSEFQAVGSSAAITNTRGEFVIQSLAPTNYRVSARISVPADHGPVGSKPGVTASAGAWAEERVDLRSGVSATVTLTLRPPLKLRGRVEFRSRSAPVDPTAIVVGLTTLELPNRPRPVHLPSRGRVDANRTFEISRVLPGDFQFVVSSPDGRWSLQSADSAQGDLLGVLSITGATPLPDVVLVLTDQPTLLYGHVAGLHASGVDAYSVVAFPSSRELWDAYSSRISVSRLASDNTFKLAGLPPGDYLVALASRPLAAPWTQEILEELSVYAISIRLGEGQTVKQDLRAGRTERDSRIK
jgi:hypothetical protein